MMKSVLGRGLAAVLFCTAFAAHAQGWPNKPVRVINPFPAGGGVDAFARPIAAKLTVALGQTFFVENLGGAGGTCRRRGSGEGRTRRATPSSSARSTTRSRNRSTPPSPTASSGTSMWSPWCRTFPT
jgi:tripartite-type tricarboxylate transporter receptor subunit TctC